METRENITEPDRSQAVVAVIPGLGESREAALPKMTTQTATAAYSVPLVLREEEVKFRVEIRRRRETVSVTGWDHGGLSE